MSQSAICCRTWGMTSDTKRLETEKGLVKCQFTLYIILMIRTFKHKGLRRFFEEDDGSKLPPDLVARIRIILSTLHAAQDIEGMNLATRST